MHRFALLVPLSLFALVALMSAAFPTMLPKLTNRWYSLVGLKTRVAEADYARGSTRLASLALFLLVAFWIMRESISK